MKTNFKENNNTIKELEGESDDEKELTKEEFEDYVSKSGAKGSFMIYRSLKEDEEMGVDEL